jgi:mRNA interferase MazF
LVVDRGSIWWADLGKPIGSAPGYRRPVLVIQSDIFNQTPIRTAIVLAITSNAERAHLPGNVVLHADQTNLPLDSVANVSQLLTIDRSRLESCIGNVDDLTMRKVSAGLRLVLDL